MGALLGARGAELIDADAISRASTAAGGTAIGPIRESFGAGFIDASGALDRQRMRSLVFDDPSARQRLESIVHPLVARAMAEQAARSTSRCLVFDVPLLVESPRWRPQLDRVIVVDCSEATQLRRVQRRSGWDADTTQAVMRQQATRLQRLAAADAVVFNDVDDMDRLRAMIDRLSARFGL